MDSDDTTLSFTESCGCGCPWEDYPTMEAARQYRMDNFKEDLYGDLYGERTDALERLHEYMKDHWMQILDDFFEELKSGTDGDARLQPSTLQEMVDMVENDDASGFFDCEDCADYTTGNRCYRNRPNPKKRPRCA